MPHRPESRPPLWVFAGAGLLAAIAGYINSVVLEAGYLPVTHLTGSVSHLGGDLVQGNESHGWMLLSILIAFVLGATVSGALIGGTRLRLGRPYGLAMLLEAALLAIAAFTLRPAPLAALPIAAFAAGLQNAMASTYGRLIVRTTHITGVATDLGLELGRALRGVRAEGWKIGLLVLLMGAFFGGGVLGWRVAMVWDGLALLGAAGVLAAMGGGYLVWRRVHHVLVR